MWYKNKDSRIRYIKSAYAIEPTQEFLRNVYDGYFLIKESYNKELKKITCTKCGNVGLINKSTKSYVCECGYKHNKEKRKLFKNFEDKMIVKTVTKQDDEELSNYYLVYVYYNYEKKLIEFTQNLIAKDIYCKEKRKKYFYNIAYSSFNSYSIVYYPNKKISEVQKVNSIDWGSVYYSNEQLDIEKLKYINKNDAEIIGYELHTLERNSYLIEILQKYNSSYLFKELKDQTYSNKLLDLFNLRDMQISNKQLLSIIKYYSSSKELSIQLYRDYLKDLKFLNLKFNRSNLLNKDYKQKHQQLSNKIADLKQKNKDEYIRKSYSGYKDYMKDGIYISYPKSQKDLNKESAVLNHCVRRYADDIIDNYCKIFFVRTDPDKPLITVEVKKNKITQFRGYDNLLESIKPSVVEKARKVMDEYIILNSPT